MIALIRMYFLIVTTRSPSPEPLYSNDGKRLNTREFRVRKKLEEERHNAIQELLSLNTNYKPPVDYRYNVFEIVSVRSLLKCQS